MRRRQGFTLVELLVAMALIIFIMAILSQAFSAAMTTFRNLKASGDMAEKLRATTQLLYRDLAADHFEGKKRLSDTNFWVNGPPQQGFFQIYQGSAPSTVAGSPCFIEGYDLDGIASYLTTNHALSFTVKLRGNQMGDFFSASAPLLTMSANFGPPEARYQSTSGGSYNYQWAEVAWFLQPSINPATTLQDTTVADSTTGSSAVPLYTLYRRQRLAVPDNNLVTPTITSNTTNYAQCLELSCWNNGGNLYFNSPMDLTVPSRRLGSGIPTNYRTLNTELTHLGVTNPTLAGADIQLNDVVSFDVRVLTPGVTNGIDPFVTLWQAPFTVLNTVAGGINNGNPSYYPAAPARPMVFDTWSSLNDGLSNYSQWNAAGQATSIPLWNGTSGPIIQAIQISIRIWDYKTNQTRQVTIVQAM